MHKKQFSEQNNQYNNAYQGQLETFIKNVTSRSFYINSKTHIDIFKVMNKQKASVVTLAIWMLIHILQSKAQSKRFCIWTRVYTTNTCGMVLAHHSQLYNIRVHQPHRRCVKMTITWQICEGKSFYKNLMSCPHTSVTAIRALVCLVSKCHFKTTHATLSGSPDITEQPQAGSRVKCYFLKMSLVDLRL